jgi:hypothetical protein
LKEKAYRDNNPEKLRNKNRRYIETVEGRIVRKKANKNYRLRYPDRANARMAVANAVRKGLLIKPATCEKCGARDESLHGHHDDYGKPLDVRWVCRACHVSIHNNQRMGVSHA